MSRAKRYRSGQGLALRAEQHEYATWRDAMASVADDPEASRGLMSIGRERGWVTPNGTLVPPGTEPPSGNDEMNAAIRRAAGRES